jgi:hypothetical protein
MNFTTFAMVLTFSGNKIMRTDFLHRGPFDPRSLTAGARSHAGRPRWPGRLGQRPSPTTLWRRLRPSRDGAPTHSEAREKRREGSKRTKSSPEALRRGQLGRRRTGEGKFRVRGARDLQGKRQRRRRFKAPTADSLGQEGDEVEVEL